MKHRINGCPIHLRSLPDDDLVRLIAENRDRSERLEEELDSLMGEHIRRTPNHNVLAFAR